MKTKILKTLALSLNAVALVALLGACSKKVDVDLTSEGFHPVGTSDELQISQSPSDGLYNAYEAANPSVNESEKIFFHTPAATTNIELGSWGLSSQDCTLSAIHVTLDLLKYDAGGAVISSQRLDYSTPAAQLEKAFKYGVRAKLTGTQGCRSVFLSFTINKT